LHLSLSFQKDKNRTRRAVRRTCSIFWIIDISTACHAIAIAIAAPEIAAPETAAARPDQSAASLEDLPERDEQRPLAVFQPEGCRPAGGERDGRDADVFASHPAK